jgi:phage protein D
MEVIKSPLMAFWVAGKEMSTFAKRQILSIELTYREKKASDGVVIFSDPDFAISSSNVFVKGRSIAFLLGWTTETRPCGPFVVKKYSVSAGADGSPKFTVHFQDLSHKLNKKQKTKKHVGKPAQILKKIAEENDLGYDIQSIESLEFSDSFPLMQAHMTDAHLIQVLANKYGYVWGVEGRTLVFKRPENEDLIGKQKDVPVLSYRINGASLLDFSCDVKFAKLGKRKGSAQKKSGIDVLTDSELKNPALSAIETIKDSVKEIAPKLGEMVTGALAGDEPDSENGFKGKIKTFDAPSGFWGEEGIGGVINDIFGDDDETEESSGDTKSKEEALRKSAGVIAKNTEIIEASISPRIASVRYRPGASVILAGLGSRFSGKYRITEVRHVYGENSFVTSMSVVKRAFGASPDDKGKIGESAEQPGNIPGNEDPGTKAPTKDLYDEFEDFGLGTGEYMTRREKRKKIDGKDDV